MLQDEQTLRVYLSSNSPIHQDDIARGFLIEDLLLWRIGLSCISAAFGYVFFIARWNWKAKETRYLIRRTWERVERENGN